MTKLVKLNFSPSLIRYERNAGFPSDDKQYLRIRAIGLTEKAVDNYVNKLKINFQMEESSDIEELDQIDNITDLGVINTNQLPDTVNQPSAEDLEITIDFIKPENIKLPCVINLNINPEIDKGITHQYKFRTSSNKVSLTITALRGSVIAKLLKDNNDNEVASKEVDVIGSTPCPKSAELEGSVSGQSFMVEVIGNMNDSSYKLEGYYKILEFLKKSGTGNGKWVKMDKK